MKRLLGSLTSTTVGIARMGVGSVVLVAWLFATGRAGDLAVADGGAWGWALLTGLILAAYVATWFAALARAQAVDVTAVLVFGAVITAALATAVQDAALAPKLGPLVMIAAGTALVFIAARRHPVPGVVTT